MTEASSFENFMFMNGNENPYGSTPSDSEEPTEADMAQMMGFSNFGSKPKPQSKKRKRELAQLATSGPGAESGSGSNTMPLGNPRRKHTAALDSSSKDMERNMINLKEEDSGSGGPNRSLQAPNTNVSHISQPTLPDSARPLPHGTGRKPSGSGEQQSQHDWHALRKGVRDRRGDIAYYQPSFVEDPWKDLV